MVPRASGAALLAGLALAAGAAAAHPLAPAFLEVREGTGGELQLLFRAPERQAPGAELRPVLPEGCTRTSTPEVGRRGTGVEIRWRVRCTTELVGARLGVAGLEGTGTDALLHVELRDGRVLRTIVTAREPTHEVPQRQRGLDVVRAYLLLGMEHILSGWDHLAFVLGLLLLVQGARALAAVVTAFTAGHSVTLSLAALGVFAPPTAPTELAIAASLLVLGVECLRPGADGRGARLPWLLAGGFGLVHGLGFAGALRAVGLPGEAVPLALFSFNLGIEAGQLAFVAAALTVLWAGRRLLGSRAAPAFPPIFRQTGAYAIGALGAFLLLDRLVP